MKTRVISGAVFVAIIATFFLLRQFVDYRLFLVLIWFICSVGSFEMARAISENTSDLNFIYSSALGVLVIPAYCIGEYCINFGVGVYFGVGVILANMIGNVVIGVVKKKGEDGFLYAIIGCIYPSILFLIMSIINGLGKQLGFVALLTALVISSLTDTLAYFVGSYFKGPKLCVKLSPKKTWSGAIGGIVGGMLGALLVFAVFGNKLHGHTWWAYLLIGIVGSIFTQLGDLVESAIKRSVGIKDMGTIMPGHGGVLDRFDGIMFSTVVVGVAFLMI